MNQISNYMADDHGYCDRLFAEAEAEAEAGHWREAANHFHAFHQSMERHLTMEEELLFPAFEEASGMQMGPTQVMRMEHQQMRDLFRGMAEALASEDGDAYLGESETLLILMQQHNAKEEQILYPMFDQHLGARSDELIDQLEQRKGG